MSKIQRKPIQRKPIQRKPIQRKPIQRKPIQRKPIKTPPQVDQGDPHWGAHPDAYDDLTLADTEEYVTDNLVPQNDVQWLAKLTSRWVSFEDQDRIIDHLVTADGHAVEEDVGPDDEDAMRSLPVNKLLRLGGETPHSKFKVTRENITELVDKVETEDPDWEGVNTELCKASLAYFAAEVLQGPPQAPYHGRFLIGHHHVEWDGLVADHKRLCVLAPRDHGKCVKIGNRVNRVDGARVPVEDWKGGEVWSYDPDTGKLVPKYAPASRPNGVKRCLRIKTKSGRWIEVTENHPLLLLGRWERADKLQVGQRVAVPYRYQPRASQEAQHAWLAGLLVGDGCLRGGPMITKTDPTIRRILINEYGATLRADPADLGLPGWTPQVREWDLYGHSAHAKRVPPQIFTARNYDVGEFLSGYLDTDSHINLHGGGSIEYYSVNRDLLRDVQHLLLRFGVLGVLSEKLGKYKGKDHHSWRLTIRGKDILPFAQAVSPRSEIKQKQLADLVILQKIKAPCSGKALDLFPKNVWQLVEHGEDWFHKSGLPRPNKQCEPTREKLRVIADAEDNAALKQLVDSPVLWDEIVEIEDIGEHETWSMCVPDLENFVAEDIINHNTYFFDFAYPIWQAVFNPNKSGFIFSATKPQAARIMEDIQAEFETNPKLSQFLPKKGSRGVWRTDQIRLSNHHTIYARGFGTKVRGAHPDWIVVDDGLTDEALYSELVRNKQIDYFASAITNMVVPGGQIIVVGTPFHETDLYGYLRGNEVYAFRTYRALNKEGEPLWGARYSAAFLVRRKTEIGGIRFTREFLCDPISDDMSLFPDWLFRGKDVEQFTVKLGAPKAFWASLGVQIYFGVDFAMSSSVQADYTVIWIMGVDPYGNRWIIDIIREKGLGFQKQLSLMVAQARKYDPALIFLESNQMQRIFGDELIRETDLPIYKFVTGVQKNNLDEGVPSMRVLLENRKFRIPRGDARSVEMTECWINEMRSFTWNNGKLQGVGAHDDTVMGCWICDQAIRRGGFDCSFGATETGEAGDDLGSPEELMRELTGEGEVEPPPTPANVQTDIHVQTSSPGALQQAVQALDDVFAQVLGADGDAWEVTDDGCVVVRVFGPKDSVFDCLKSTEGVKIVKVVDGSEIIGDEQSPGGRRQEEQQDVLSVGAKARDGSYLGAPSPGALGLGG